MVIGSTAPTFTAPALVAGEQSEINLADYQGRWVVLFFYAGDFTFV
jgi:peroxiredoxin 2/4